jgi:hypothetical protein
MTYIHIELSSNNIDSWDLNLISNYYQKGFLGVAKHGASPILYDSYF